MSKQIPERVEEICISMLICGSAYEKHKEAVHTLEPKYKPEDVQPSDQLKTKFKFRAEYFNIVKSLQAVEELCDDPDVLILTKCSALKKRRILMYEVLKKLDNIIQKVGDRE